MKHLSAALACGVLLLSSTAAWPQAVLTVRTLSMGAAQQTVEGALPIFSGADEVGSVGVSGAPGGEKDAACAQAGIDRVAKELAEK